MQKLEREIDQFTSIRVVSVLGLDVFEQEAKKFLEKKWWYSQNEELELSIASTLEKLHEANWKLNNGWVEEAIKLKEELLLDLAILILAVLQANSGIFVLKSFQQEFEWIKTYSMNNYLYWDVSRTDLITTPDAVIRIYKYENYKQKWWQKIAGSFKDDSTFDEAKAIGKLWREMDTCASLRSGI